MGQQILTDAVQALCDAGIPVQRAAPGQRIAEISTPVAAVCLKSADMRNKKVTVLVSIWSPAAMGMAKCEDKALEAGVVLSTLGGKCNVGECRFEGRIGLFCTEVTGEFESYTPKITINGVLLKHVLAFTSWRTLDDEVTDWYDAKWQFRLEEYYPLGETEEGDIEGSFILVHSSESGTESFIDSTWTYQRRVWDASGVRQLRLGVASEMDVG